MDYDKLAAVYGALEKTTKNLEKTSIIAGLLKKTPSDELPDITNLLQGRVFPQWDEREIGVSDKLAIKAISNSTGKKPAEVEHLLSREGDLGLAVEKLLGKGRQLTLSAKKSLTTKDVVEKIRGLVVKTGKGSVEQKLAIVSGLLNRASPQEAKYIVRTVLEKLRTGVGSGILRDALVAAFLPKVCGIQRYCEKCKSFSQADKCASCGVNIKCSFKEEAKKDFGSLKKYHADSPEELKDIVKHVDVIIPKDEKSARKLYNYMVDEVQKAYDMSTDFGIVAQILKKEGLEGLGEVSLQPGRAIKVMLYIKAKDFKDAFEVVGRPALAERKFDGFRMQIHGKEGKVKLFTRRLDDVTKQFPDVEELVKNHVKSKNFVLDSEIVGIDNKGNFVPFQNISQRIKRKYDIKEMVKELPVIVEIFDAMEINGKSLLNEPYEERRKTLKKIVKELKGRIVLVEQKKVSTEKELEAFYNKVLKEGVEGVMLKNIKGIYKPGSRVGYGIKLKPEMETLDLVIVAADWGEGKRAKWLSSFTLACRDGKELKEIGKVGTGIKEKSGEGVSFAELTKELRPLITGQKGKTVNLKPKIILEVAYQEIQKSPSYSSGYALRFPRVVRLRTAEKGLEDINTVRDVERLYRQQK